METVSHNTPDATSPTKSCSDQTDAQVSEADIVIVGAGLVGASLACALGQFDPALRIVLVEATEQSPTVSTATNGSVKTAINVFEFDPRVVALTPASQAWLTSMGAWSFIESQRACAYTDMQVWDGEGNASIHFDSAAVRQTRLGHIVENSIAVAAVHQQLANTPAVSWRMGTRIESFSVNQHSQYQTHIALSNGEQWRSQLLIAADGAHSSIRQQLDTPMWEWDYQHTAIVTTVHTEKPHQFTAWQRFMHTGPLAFLPLQQQAHAAPDEHYCSIVWSLESDEAERVQALTDDDFKRELSAAFEHRLGAVTHVAERFALPLRQRHAKEYISPGVVLVGDAAHTIHPLAGQGVNLGLMDAQALFTEITRAKQRSLPLNNFSILRRYQRQRLTPNLSMMAAMESFKRLFGCDHLGVNWLRNTGLRTVNSVPLLKRLIAQQML